MNKFKKILTVVVVVGFSFFVNFSNALASNLDKNQVAAGGADNNANTVVTCGFDIPPQITNITSTVVNLIKIVVPIILIILGMLDMGKAVASQKEDEIKKGQKTLMSRCIAAAIVFFVVAIVQLLINIISPDGKDTILNCIDTIINNK